VAGRRLPLLLGKVVDDLLKGLALADPGARRISRSTVCCGSRNATCVKARSLLDIQPVGCLFAMSR
jgi:hypothetical protein